MFDYKNASSSPWGKIDEVTKIVRGCSIVNTPGHGGVRITEKCLREHAINADFLIANAAIQYGEYLWFEEDCNLPMLFFDCPKLLLAYAEVCGANKDEVFETFKKSVEHWFPKYFVTQF